MLLSKKVTLIFFQTVEEEGGMDSLNRDRRWSRVGSKMGYPSGRGVGGTLKHHYERILFPFYLFKKGETVKFIPEVRIFCLYNSMVNLNIN